MFLGKHYHSLEANRRTSVPKSFRSKTNEWIVTRGLDGGLFLFASDDFVRELEHIGQRTFTNKDYRDFVRLMMNEAQSLIPDKNGRVQLPEYLTEFADLSKNIVFVGSGKYIEIWNRERYHSYLDSIESKAGEIAQRVDATNDQSSEK